MINLGCENFKNKKILIGSPICQNNLILKEFLISLEEVEKEMFDVGYCFIDDNKELESKKLLEEFQNKIKNVTILNIENCSSEEYFCDDYTHRWNNDLVAKVTMFKNSIIKYFLENEYDYLFFIDSDIVLHPLALKSLVSKDKDIISNIFWTKWSPDGDELPQVWLKDAYTMHDAKMNEPKTRKEIDDETKQFLIMLKKPGVYRVGGLGACTLIKREPLLKGVNFDEMYNLSFWGEDRFFCVRAVAYGFELYVDTNYPAYHIYRKDNLKGVEKFKEDAKKRNYDILGYKLSEKLTAFLDEYYKFSYKESISYDWMKFFYKREGERLQKIRAREEMSIKQFKITSIYKVADWKIMFFEVKDRVAIKYKIIINGIKNNYSFSKEDEKIAFFKKEKSEWKIESLVEEKKEKILETPYIRKVKEKNKLTLSMIVKNEEGRYLERVLNQNKKYITNAVIIDDGSTDRTKEIIKDILGDIDLKLIENNQSMFLNEVNLRKRQWNETIKTSPDWILSLDADEVFEDAFEENILELIDSDPWCDAYAFRLYDFWDENNFREDANWKAHFTYRTFLTRYQKDFNYTWIENPVHCGRLPNNVLELNTSISKYRLKHYGWMRQEDRLKKYARYKKHDPQGIYGNVNQYASILDPNPRLVRWSENE
ncbi:glycosyltransferase [uncultured Clostridium sp.]|uniref:glycosyltransferase n=1 Tax=uncultured Clostridium sp. TaxID=59620 RepID=UPI002632DAE5|nr:glycosyltransferase [uncultured Clostridium sp.]